MLYIFKLLRKTRREAGRLELRKRCAVRMEIAALFGRVALADKIRN